MGTLVVYWYTAEVVMLGKDTKYLSIFIARIRAP